MTRTAIYIMMLFATLSVGFICCKKEVCEPVIPIFNLKILEYVDSTNYIFGVYKKVEFNKLKIYSLKNNDTLNIATKVVNNFEMPIVNDSIMQMNLNEFDNKKIYIKYPSNQIDSFEINYYSYNSACGCNGVIIDRVWYMKNEIYTGTYNFFTIYK